MLIAIGRNLLIVCATLLIVGISAALWPIDEIRPERQLENSGAELAYAYDETVLIGVSMEGVGFGDEQLAIASRVPSLQRLSLADSNVTKRGIQSLQSLPRLMYLNLGRTRWTFEAVDEIAQLSKLRELNLEGCDWLRDEHLARFIALPNLELLNLSATSITPAAFEHLARFPALKFLILSQCSQFDDTTIDPLIELCQKRPIRLNLAWTEITLPALTRLRAGLPGIFVDLRPESMVGLRQVAERGQFLTNSKGEIVGFRRRLEPDGFIPDLLPGDLAVVSSLPGIVRLSLEQTNVTDELLLEANPMPNLENLRLSATRISDVGLQVLDRFPNLNTLVITDAALDGNGLEHLRHVPHLQTLQVQTRLGDEIVPYLTLLSDLRALAVQAPLTDAGVEQLSKLENLQSLELIQTRVRARGIEKLSNLPELTELVFDGGVLDDTDMEALARLKAVRRIVLARTHVSRDGKNRLASVAPAVGVTWAGYEANATDPLHRIP